MRLAVHLTSTSPQRTPQTTGHQSSHRVWRLRIYGFSLLLRAIFRNFLSHRYLGTWKLMLVEQLLTPPITISRRPSKVEYQCRLGLLAGD